MARAYLFPNEIEKLERAASNVRDRLLMRLLFHLGCRVSECLALEASHVDLESRTITIQHLKRRIRFDCPTCGRKLSKTSAFCSGCGSKVSDLISKAIADRRMRVLPVDDETVEMLKEYVAAGKLVEQDGRKFLFGISRHRAWQIVKESAQRAGLPKLTNPESGKVHNVSPHKLRDAFAVNAMKSDDSGDGMRLLQEHLGHASFNTTARYRKVSGDEHREWYRKLWKKNPPDPLN